MAAPSPLDGEAEERERLKGSIGDFMVGKISIAKNANSTKKIDIEKLSEKEPTNSPANCSGGGYFTKTAAKKYELIVV